MKTKIIFKLSFFILFFYQFSLAQYFVDDNDLIKPETYKQRRENVLSKMETNSVAVFISADSKVRNTDCDYLYKQEPYFDYLTGCKEKGCVLVLISSGFEYEGKKVKEILFLREGNAMSERWTGKLLGSSGALNILKFDCAINSKNFKDIFTKILDGKNVLYLLPGNQDIFFDILIDKKYKFADERKNYFAEKYPNLKTKSLMSEIAGMRQVKSIEEIEYIKKAVLATTTGFIEAAKSCELNMFEYELQAIIEYSFKRFGCEYPGFGSIVGSGPNSLTFHYDASRRQMKDGEVVVMDIGGEYHGYSADLTRTIPVNGKFSEAQKEIYKIVLKANEETIKIIKKGIGFKELEESAIKYVSEGLLNLGIIKDAKEARKFMPHGVSHNIGLDVHDATSGGTLSAGQIITIEPGIYIPANTPGVDSKYFNIGIRIEDDVLVTETGNEVLTKAAPKEMDKIEAIMKEKGIGNSKIGK